MRPSVSVRKQRRLPPRQQLMLKRLSRLALRLKRQLLRRLLKLKRLSRLASRLKRQLLGRLLKLRMPKGWLQKKLNAKSSRRRCANLARLR